MFAPSTFSAFGAANPDCFGAAKGKKRKGKGKKAGKAKKSAKDVASFDFGPPETLWMSDPAKRKVDASGIFSPEDTLIAVARGAMPSGPLRSLEARATIVGGLSALNAAGVRQVNVKRLLVQTAQDAKDDAALIQAAGAKGKGEKALLAAAAKVRDEVHAAGLDGLAWDFRALAILGSMKGAQLAHSTTAAILAIVFPPAGALAGGHVAITASIAKKLADGYTKDIKKRLGPGDALDDGPMELQPRPAVVPYYRNPYLLGAGAVAAAGAIYLFRSRK